MGGVLRVLAGIGFEYPFVFAGLFLFVVPVVLWFFSSRKVKALARFFEVYGVLSKRKRLFVVNAVLLFLVILSASVPFLVYREKKNVSFDEAQLLSGKKVLVVFLIDVSKSMNYPLGTSTRIEVVKRVIKETITALGKNASVMIAVFSGNVHQVFFGESDKAFVVVDEIVAGEKYTAIGDALSYALSVAKASDTPTAVILVSDGRNNYGSDPVTVAKMYKYSGIPLLILAVGERGILPKIAEAADGKIYDVNEFTSFSLEDLVGELSRRARYMALKARGEAYIEEKVRDYSLFYLVSLIVLALFIYTCLNEW